MSFSSLSAAGSSLKSKEGVSMRVRPSGWRSWSRLMSMEAERMWEVWAVQPWTNFATEASWSLDERGETRLVSSRRRRKEDLPDAGCVRQGRGVGGRGETHLLCSRRRAN